MTLKSRVVQYAREAGFDEVRITSAEPFSEHSEVTKQRVRKGYMDGMPWYTEERVGIASDPESLLAGARSFIAVAMSYLPREDDEEYSVGIRGRVARYAHSPDYHLVMKERLRTLADELCGFAGRAVKTRIFVDDSPLLERAVAERAGLGWFGKNTNILTATYGSWVFLGFVLTDLYLDPDEPLKKSCGECIRCIPACPTGAIVTPYAIDARRCISYLTIECRGPIPLELRPLVGDWVFGCDICQEVCPVNESASPSETASGRSGTTLVELIPLLSMTQDEFSVYFKNSPIKRAKLVGLQRNVCVALGNIRDRKAVPALVRALLESEYALVRSHSAWALGRMGGSDVQASLLGAITIEGDEEVRKEIQDALDAIDLTSLLSGI